LRPVGLAKVERMVLEVRKSHDKRQLRLEANGSGEGSEEGAEDKGRPLKLRPIGFAKVERKLFRKSHDGRLLRPEANGPGECGEDGVEDKRVERMVLVVRKTAKTRGQWFWRRGSEGGMQIREAS
jgi:hypothetical protein